MRPESHDAAMAPPAGYVGFHCSASVLVLLVGFLSGMAYSYQSSPTYLIHRAHTLV